MENIYRNSAWFYDVDNRDNLYADIPFYIDYAKALAGEVLELGCGTGRVALSLAKQGIKVTGLDLSDQMLEVFKDKLDAQADLKDKITLIHGNMADFNLNHKFSLIIAPFRAFQALTNDEDIANSLQCIKDHLSDDGVFIVNMFNPRPNMDETWCYPEIVQWERDDETTGNHIVKKHRGDRIDTKNQIIYVQSAFEVTDKNGASKRITDDLKLKYFYRDQIVSVIESAGLFVEESFGWYDKASIEENNREIILVCKKIN